MPDGWRKADLQSFDSRLSDMREAAEAGEGFKPRKPVRVTEYATGWLSELYDAAQAGRISKLTYNAYEGLWTNHLQPFFGAMLLAALDEGDIRRYTVFKQAEGRLSPVAIDSSLTPLSAMLTDAVAEGLIVRNPCRQPRRARHANSRRRTVYLNPEPVAPKFLEPDEARALLAATPDSDRAMVLAALTTGFRRGELLGVRWEDIRWADRRIDLRGQLQNRDYVGCKYGSEREVVLYSGLARELGKRRRAEGYVFTSRDGRPWSNDGPTRTFLSAAYEAAGLRRPGQLWHVLRHTYASILANGGVRRDVVERLMGHAAKGTTSLYTHLFRDAFEGVEEALDAAFGVNVESTDVRVPIDTDGTLRA